MFFFGLRVCVYSVYVFVPECIQQTSFFPPVIQNIWIYINHDDDDDDAPTPRPYVRIPASMTVRPHTHALMPAFTCPRTSVPMSIPHVHFVWCSLKNPQQQGFENEWFEVEIDICWYSLESRQFVVQPNVDFVFLENMWCLKPCGSWLCPVLPCHCNLRIIYNSAISTCEKAQAMAGAMGRSPTQPPTDLERRCRKNRGVTSQSHTGPFESENWEPEKWRNLCRSCWPLLTIENKELLTRQPEGQVNERDSWWLQDQFYPNSICHNLPRLWVTKWISNEQLVW